MWAAPGRGTAWKLRLRNSRLTRSLPLGPGCPVSALTSGGPSHPGMRSPPIQPATKSSSWKLPMAGAAEPRVPGVGSVPVQGLLVMAHGRARRTDEVRDAELPAGTSFSTTGSEWLGIAEARGPPGSRSKCPRAADITPPVDLKGAARGPGEGVSTGSYGSSSHLL